MFLTLFAALAAQSAPTTAAPAPTSPATAATCTEPVYLVVWIDRLDRTKSKAYGDGLRSSGIVARNGGKYQMVSPPLMVLEGQWPAERGFVVESYPCLEALKAMWFSDEYQKKLKPLRAGSGEYTVAVFKSFKPPVRPGTGPNAAPPAVQPSSGPK
jgi:uncharacterized protein (DUF1330 family)